MHGLYFEVICTSNNILYARDHILDLKKIIEYDRKHNNGSILSTSLYKDWDQSYSQRMKSSTPNKNAIDRSCYVNEEEHENEVDLISKINLQQYHIIHCICGGSKICYEGERAENAL